MPEHLNMIPGIFNAASDEDSEGRIYKENVLFTAARRPWKDRGRAPLGDGCGVFSERTFWPFAQLCSLKMTRPSGPAALHTGPARRSNPNRQ